MQVSGNPTPISSPSISKQPSKVYYRNLLNPEKQLSLETINRITHSIVETLANQQKIEDRYLLGKLSEKLHYDAESIKKETSGISGFFKYLFRSGVKAQKLQLAERMKMLKDFIDNVVDAQPKTVILEENKEQPGHQLLAAIQDVISLDDERPLPADEIPGPVVNSPPPPPGNMPPPPPPPAPAKKKTPEEIHQQGEERRLKRQLDERANPDTFYQVTPPKDEMRLLGEQKNYEELIAYLESQDPVDQALLAKENAMLARVNSQLVPMKKPINSRDQEFSSKIAKYTNDELKIMIALAFEGQEPEATDLNYATWQRKEKLLNGVLQDWNKGLANSESAKAFRPYQLEWKKYVTANLYGIVSTLENRLLPQENREHLEEPTYQITPFAERKTAAKAKAVSAPVEADQGGKAPSLDDILKGKGGLRKASRKPKAPQADVAKKTPSAAQQLRSRLRKTTSEPKQ